MEIGIFVVIGNHRLVVTIFPIIVYSIHKENASNISFILNRTLSETVRTLKNQMTDLQSQMSLLTKQLDEERRSRLSLAATVKRSIGVVDGSVP